ncbi:purine-cytosine permease family protein [Halomonas sp. V046]|uniref:purine-cytosine permease family protein n=1 Tax=Halomonas sp. V046 TaxID=3459611 RepID=UPI004044DB34
MSTQSAQASASPETDDVAQSEELEYQRIPPSRQLSGKYFLGAYSGEHVAGTEFVIGAALVTLGVGTSDLIWGLILGNFMAVLSWAWICSPVATRTRMTVYWFLARLAGKKISYIYNIVNGLFYAVIAGAMITVSASAFRVMTDIPPQTGLYPTSVSFVVLALFVGAFTVWLTLKGFKLIANFSTVCAPWMAIMFLVSGILAIPIVTQLGAEQGMTGLGAVLDGLVWTGVTPSGEAGINMWVIAAWAWGINLPMHLGMSDMSILRFARKSSYGYFSAAGMYIGHFMAWVCAGILGATSAMLLKEALVDLDPGAIAYRLLGAMGLVAVVVAGWTTSIPSLYRSGLAFQAVFHRHKPFNVALAVGAATTAIACFPFAFSALLDVLSYFVMVMAPVGAIIAAEHFALPRLRIRPLWREHQGIDDNRPALITWVIGVALGATLIALPQVHLFTVFIPVWLTAFIVYPVLCRVMGANTESGIDYYAEAYGPVDPPELPGESAEPNPPVRRDPWYFVALGCLVVILIAGLWSWMGDPAGAVDYVETFKMLVVPVTVVYFIAATLWIRNRRKSPAVAADDPHV